MSVVYQTSLEALMPHHRGRPRGKQHDATIRVRLPSVVVDALQLLARRSHIHMSQIVRAGIVEALNNATGPMAAVAQNPDAAASRRMGAIQNLRLLSLANLHLSPEGLRMAREAAMEEAAECR